MIKAFDLNESVHIVLEAPFLKEDFQTLLFELSKPYNKYHVEFGKIYNINIDTVALLYRKFYLDKKNIKLTTHKSRLNKYLTRLGFKSHFISVAKNYVVKPSEIEIVLIGGSSDSSSKIIEIVKNVDLTNVALVIVQHVEENRVGIFDEILQVYTKQTVKYAQEGDLIEKGFIYLASSSRHLKVLNGCFKLTSEPKYNYSRPSISLSYESFSLEYKEKLLIIQECGYARDGVDKIKLLKENNSKFIIQDVEECQAKPMVENALEVGLYDYVLNEKEIIRYLKIVNKNVSNEVWIEYLLYTIYEKYKYDFRFYHRDTINRRLGVFMIKHDIKNIQDAIAIILFNMGALKSFVLEVSINITEFFRHPETFKGILTFIDENYKHAHHMKIWSAGCSTGEEVYSMALALESISFLEKSIIYATDFNGVVLEEAKNGVYPLSSFEIGQANISKENLDINFAKSCMRNDKYFIINEKIRKKVLFFQHNLATDSSFNEFDVIMCNNVIIYFEYSLQLKVFQLFYDSLKFGGCLVLGQSETIIKEFESKFERSSINYNIFKKVA